MTEYDLINEQKVDPPKKDKSLYVSNDARSEITQLVCPPTIKDNNHHTII